MTEPHEWRIEMQGWEEGGVEGRGQKESVKEEENKKNKKWKKPEEKENKLESEKKRKEKWTLVAFVSRRWG